MNFRIRTDIYARLGIYDWEKHIKQRLTVELHFIMNNDEGLCIDYDILIDEIKNMSLETHYNLLEDYVKSMKELILGRYNQYISFYQITATKKRAPLYDCNFSISVEGDV